MAAERHLSERKAAILDALVRHYIRTGEAVGSEAIAASTGLGVSSATIRNELAALEELGYVAQPHTSSGRVPTDLAYRQYVDRLPAGRRLKEAERLSIVRFFDEALADVDEILRGTTQLLSSLTRYASLALAPSSRERQIVRCEVVDLGSATLLLAVFDSGHVDKRLIDLPDPGDDAESLSRTLTDVLHGKAAGAAVAAARERAQAGPPEDREVFARVAETLETMAEGPAAEHVFLGGTANIAAEEAFRRRETLREVLQALERESELLRLLRHAASSPEVSVTIGRENPMTGMLEASVVAAPFGSEGRAAGTIGVVGPLRMDYAMAIAAVRAVSGRLSAAVKALWG